VFTTASDVLAFLKEQDVRFVDVRFTDLPGVQQHITIPASTVDEAFFSEGIAFDGSSIRGFASIHESDLQLIPDPTTAYVDAFRKEKTLNLVFDIYNPRNGEIYAKDPRQVAKKAEKYLASTGIADTAFFAPEAEFYIFDDVRYEVKQNGSFYAVDSEEGAWNSGRIEEGGNLGNKTPYKGGYFPVSPVDKQADLRDDISLKLIDAGLILERAHHEVGTGGQAEINYRFDTMVHAADDILKFKYIVKNTAELWGKTATFMPKPLFGDNGSGMHTHQSLWNGGTPLFYDEAGYGGLSDIARWYIGGLLRHAPAVLAFTNPTVNSYHRLVPGFEAPVNLVYSAGNRSASIRIPITGTNPKAKRIEFRAPTPRGTRISPSPRSCWRAWTVSRTASSRTSRWTRTSTSCRRKKRRTSRRCPARSARSSTRSRPTTTSSPRATCSPRNSSRPGSSTNARRSSSPSRSARTPSNMSCTTASELTSGAGSWPSTAGRATAAITMPRDRARTADARSARPQRLRRRCG